MNSIDRILGPSLAEADGERICQVCKKPFKPVGRWDTKCQDCYGKPTESLAEKMVMILLQVPDEMEDTSADAVLKMLTGKSSSPEEMAAKETAAEGQGYGFLKNPQIQG